MKASTIKIAVFDIDGTIFRSSLAVELIHSLVREGIFPKQAGKEIEFDYQNWLDRKGSYPKYLTQLINVFMKYIPEKSEKEILKVSSKIIEEQGDRQYIYTRNLVEEFKKNNFHLVAVSGSPYFLVSKFAELLKFNASFGSHFVVENGKFTGGVIKIGDEDKFKTLKEYVEAQHLNVNWKASTAIGDTTSDLPLLESVGKPIAFNPNLELAKIAQKNKWTIVVERKDVIYKLNNYQLLK